MVVALTYDVYDILVAAGLRPPVLADGDIQQERCGKASRYRLVGQGKSYGRVGIGDLVLALV